MKKFIFAFVSACMFSMAAHATGFGNTYNDSHNDSHDMSPSATGGQGGTGVGVGISGAAATGGNVGDIRNTNKATVSDSGNSTNRNTNRNTNTNNSAINNANANANEQGQSQGQAQKQGQTQSSVSDAKQSQSTDNANNSSQAVNVAGDTYTAARNPVAQAIAIAAPPSAPCMGSSAMGAQGAVLGISLSSTWTSKDCNNRENIRFAFTYGNPTVAAEMMRATMPEYAAAEKRVADHK